MLGGHSRTQREPLRGRADLPEQFKTAVRADGDGLGMLAPHGRGHLGQRAHIGLGSPQERMAARIPGATLRFFEGGHLFMIQDRTAVPTMAEWLLA